MNFRGFLEFLKLYVKLWGFLGRGFINMISILNRDVYIFELGEEWIIFKKCFLDDFDSSRVFIFNYSVGLISVIFNFNEIIWRVVAIFKF